MTLDARVGRGGASGHPLLGRVALVATVIVLAGHGLVHLMGAALLWKLGEPANLSYADAVPEPGTTAGCLVVNGLVLVLAVVSWLRARAGAR